MSMVLRSLARITIIFLIAISFVLVLLGALGINLPLCTSISCSIALVAGITLFSWHSCHRRALHSYFTIEHVRSHAKELGGKGRKDPIIIKLVNVTKDYTFGNETVHALRGVSLEIENGEFVTIMGPSGSGKSTLLNIIALLDAPSNGDVIINGRSIYATGSLSGKRAAAERFTSPLKSMRARDLKKESALALARRLQIGIVFQHFNLIPVLSALDNVMLPMSTLNISDANMRVKAIGLLEKGWLER